MRSEHGRSRGWLLVLAVACCACGGEGAFAPIATVSELGVCTAGRAPYDWHGAHRPLPDADAQCVVREVTIEAFGIPKRIERDGRAVTFVAKREASDGRLRCAYYVDDANGRGGTFPCSVRDDQPFVAVLGLQPFALATNAARGE
jgi:hypothetical protein